MKKLILVFSVVLFALPVLADEPVADPNCETLHINMGKHRLLVPWNDEKTHTKMRHIRNGANSVSYRCGELEATVFRTSTSIRGGKAFAGYWTGVSLHEEDIPDDTFNMFKELNPDVKIDELPVKDGFRVFANQIYISMDKELVTPAGNPMVFNCQQKRYMFACKGWFVWNGLHVSIGNTVGDFTFADLKPAYFDTLARVKSYVQPK